MNTVKLNKWADLLLDTGKRNNLINFKDTKAGTVEILLPDFDALFNRVEHLQSFEVYDPKLDENDDDFLDALYNVGQTKSDNLPASISKYITKEEYFSAFKSKLKKSSQILVYNPSLTPIRALNNIGKKARTAIEETGVNIAYMAFGFINWAEQDHPEHIMRAPILLVPITVAHESAIAPYFVKITSNDIILNPTFSFKLKTDYGITLPEYDDEGIDEYFKSVESSLAPLNWAITKECKIGIFSFQKINMHKDLKDNAPIILKNKNVCALLGEQAECKSCEQESEQTPSPAQTEIDAPLFCVVDADSSQTDAIKMVKTGQSFVLQGPPGTGKSQTITNIIAQCLADGKKVLFVSEKLAALNVVYDKLKKAGLEEFCLELHSHKANKKALISQLTHTLKAQRSGVSDRAQREIDAKNRAEDKLDEYVLELHKTRPAINKTLFSLYEEASSLRKAPKLEFVINGLDKKGEDYLDKAEQLLTQYAQYTRNVGENYRENPWFGYCATDSTYQSTTQVNSDLLDSITLLKELLSINQKISEAFGITFENLYEADVLKEFFSLMAKSRFINPALFDYTTLTNCINSARSMGELAKQVLQDKKTLDEIYSKEIYKLKGQTLYNKLAVELNSPLKRFFSGEYRSIVKQLKLLSKDGQKVKYDQAVSLMQVLTSYQQNSYKFSALEQIIAPKLSFSYEGLTTDFATLVREFETLSSIFSTGLNFTAFKELTKEQFIKAKSQFVSINDDLDGAFNKYGQAQKRLEEKFDKKEFDVKTASVNTLIEKYQACAKSIDVIDNWCEFTKLLNELEGLELRRFIDLAISQKIEPNSILSAYRWVFYSQWIDFILHQTPLLLSLSRIPHDEAVMLFKQKDELLFEINKAKIKAKVSGERPSLDMIAPGSAVSVLLRESEKKRKQKSIRLLLDEITELAQTLKPCFLMSPLSVSTFLTPEFKFDVVVFDEASQIFPQDAIGAIYRGKQLIVVGDSKQMPPSNFFNVTTSQDEDEDAEDDLTDFESILDICATAFPQKRLKWHYRSRHEQLIAFSNKNFYENDLVTFPSSQTDRDGIGVDYIFVEGIFDRKTHTNKIEAEKIVDLVFENLEKYPERSLGVVAFSISQQTLIDKLIQRRRKQNPAYEEFFSADSKEPFFVKNLETVQGDERDTIIFSVAYGKDGQGKMLLNFGPLNREGGERRLNVAITRAKRNVLLVSSMHYTDIDLSRTQSVGAKLLREYLDYAQNGQRALAKNQSSSIYEETESDFVLEVCEFLTENGFSVDTQVGSSSFKIDLAVKTPDSLDYALCIECDGKNYHQVKSTRDRDRLRQSVLEGMGWQFYRIWSTDWFRNKTLEQKRLLERVNLAVEKAKSLSDKESKPQQNKQAPTPAPQKQDLATEKELCFEEVIPESHFKFPKYVMANDLQIAQNSGYDKLKTIIAIINLEAPISEEWLLKRLLFLFGRKKITSVVIDEFNRLARSFIYFNIVRHDGFLYVQGRETTMLRVPQENCLTAREIKYVPLEELALGIKEILKQNVSVEKDGLFRLICKQLGFSRMGDAIESRLDEALKLIADQISVDGQMICIK